MHGLNTYLKLNQQSMDRYVASRKAMADAQKATADARNAAADARKGQANLVK